MQKPEDFIAALLNELAADQNITVRHIPISELFGDAALGGLGAAIIGSGPDTDSAYATAPVDQAGEYPAEVEEAPEEEEGPCGCFLQGEIQGYAKALAFHSHGVRWEFLDADEQDFLLERAAEHLTLI
jgi:hypothetical protein